MSALAINRPWRLLAATVGSAALLSVPTAQAADAPTVVGWGDPAPLGLSANFGTYKRTPTAIDALSGASAAAVGPKASYALAPSGVLAAGEGFTGLGSEKFGENPFTLIPQTAGAKAVATGFSATLIVRADGTVLGFGPNNSGAAGATPGTAVATPTPIAGLSDIVAVSVGYTFSLALKADGTVWSWGQASTLGSSGAVAGGDTGTPQQVALPVGAKAVAIAASAWHHDLAVLDDGSVWAWGENEYGELGTGATSAPVDAPVQVIPPAAAGVPKAVSVAAGDADSFALYDDGSWKAWGYNGYGNLGLGNGAVDVPAPTAPSPALTAAHPTNYPPLSAIVATGDATYAVAGGGSGVAGRVLVWGTDDSGQFGFGAGASAYDFATPYTGAPGVSAQGQTEIPQTVPGVKGVPWLASGSDAHTQIAPSVPTLRSVGPPRLPFFSQPVGTVTAAKSIAFQSQGDPSTVTSVTSSSREFEILGKGTDDLTDQPLPISVATDGYLGVEVRFIPTGLGERTGTLTVTTLSGEKVEIALSGYGTELPGATPGEKGGDGSAGKDGSSIVGPRGLTGPAGPAGKDGVVSFRSKKASTTVKRGRRVTLRFTLANATSAWLARTTATARVPKGLRASGKKSLTVIGLPAGRSRTVTLSLKIGRRAKLGSSTVELRIPFGAKSITTSAVVTVTR